MARFEVRITVTVEIEIADAVLARHQDGPWAAHFYGLNTPELIAEHLAYNLAIKGRDLSDLDGFADRTDNEARVINVEYDYDDTRRVGR